MQHTVHLVLTPTLHCSCNYCTTLNKLSDKPSQKRFGVCVWVKEGR